jgi:ubiquinone/menaquinone biosynthesis C-methylase UbiE
MHNILDIACGPGGWVLDLAFEYPKTKVVGIDISSTMVEYARVQAWTQGLENASFTVLNALQPLAFPDHPFDLVNARSLVGFMPDKAWPVLLQECTRVTRPGGVIRMTEFDEPGTTNSAASSNATTYPVKVFFSKYPESVNTNSLVYAVDRTSPTIAVGTFSLQLLIAGPTLTEQRAGYFTELNTMLSGPSNCSGALPVGGPDFFLTLNKKGSVPETGTATVKFCRSLYSSGIGADARVQAEVTATLKQFSNIKKVVILTKDGHCSSGSRPPRRLRARAIGRCWS